MHWLMLLCILEISPLVLSTSVANIFPVWCFNLQLMPLSHINDFFLIIKNFKHPEKRKRQIQVNPMCLLSVSKLINSQSCFCF